MTCNCTESKMCLACGPAKSAKHRPSDTGGAIPADFSVSRYSDTRNRGVLVIFERRLTDAELEAVRAALASKGDTGGDLSAAMADLQTRFDEQNSAFFATALKLKEAEAALATAPRAAIPADGSSAADISYELIQDDELVASTSGGGAWEEIQRYAAQYEQDGPVEIIKCVRTPTATKDRA